MWSAIKLMTLDNFQTITGLIIACITGIACKQDENQMLTSHIPETVRMREVSELTDSYIRAFWEI